MEIIVGGGIGVLAYNMYLSRAIPVAAAKYRDQLFDPRMEMNKKTLLISAGVKPAEDDDPAVQSALMDAQLKDLEMRYNKRMDYNARESGVARTAGQRLMWLRDFLFPKMFPNYVEPEDSR